MGLSPTHSMVETPSREFFREAMEFLSRARIPFLVGGAFAFVHQAGIDRSTKDLDIFVRRDDVLALLQGAADVIEGGLLAADGLDDDVNARILDKRRRIRCEQGGVERALARGVSYERTGELHRPAELPGVDIAFLGEDAGHTAADVAGAENGDANGARVSHPR